MPAAAVGEAARGEDMKPSDWRSVRITWTWLEVTWILNHAGRERLERLISYGRDVRDLAENPTPPLVAWAVDKWLREHEKPGAWHPSSNDVKELLGGKL